MRILNTTYLINIVAASVATLHSVCMSNLKVSIKDNSSTAFLCKILVLVFGVHVIFAEWTSSVIKFWTVECK